MGAQVNDYQPSWEVRENNQEKGKRLLSEELWLVRTGWGDSCSLPCSGTYHIAKNLPYPEHINTFRPEGPLPFPPVTWRSPIAI